MGTGARSILSVAIAAAIASGACHRKIEPPLTVFAAASLRDSMTEVAAAFTRDTGITVAWNVAASSDLAQQVLATDLADVFVSADEGWMDAVAAKGRILPDTRTAFLSNALVVIVRDDAPWTIANPRDLAAHPIRGLSMGDPAAVPAGRYAKAALERIPHDGRTLWDALAGRVVPAIDAPSARALVEADPEIAGIVYRTDAASPHLRVAYTFGPGETPPIRYVAAAIAGRPRLDDARRFVAFLSSPEAQAVFAKHGFIPAEGAR